MGQLELIEQLDNVSKNDARILEEEYRNGFNANLNSIKCHTTNDQKKEYRQNYYQLNKPQIRERQKNYRDQNKIKI